MEAVVSVGSYKGFEQSLRSTSKPSTAERKLRHLYEVAVRSPDPDIRDYFFENFPDRRRMEKVLAEPWWPPEARFLAQNLSISEKSRIIRELDNCFRWQQRAADILPERRPRVLFLKEGMCCNTAYHRLSRLCVGLEVVLPGHPDLPHLRNWLRGIYKEVWPASRHVVVGPRRVSEVERLLDGRRHWKTGEIVSEDTKEGYRRALMLHYDLLKGKGREFAFDADALSVYARHVWSKLGIVDTHTNASCSRSSVKEWSDATGWSMCEKLAPFIPEPSIRSEWHDLVRFLKNRAARRGEIKRKEQALSDRPIDLEGLFLRAQTLCYAADAELRVQVRHGIHLVIGALGILLFYPLRVGDLLRLTIGRELVLREGRWLLAPQFIQKNNSSADPLLLPEEAGSLIEFALLRGAPRAHLGQVYTAAQGRPFLVSPRSQRAYERSSFGALFSRHIGHRPHIIRSVWCDELVRRGVDRTMISVMLQHNALISQEHYEIVSKKIRRVRALSALQNLATSAMLES
ncbi:hypothetical protein [Salipiger sp.]|uniref:hypothetical protein n=1 Tax=Salipiger sp. TaxID=2078585 RepID=UPI003A974ED1